MLCITLTTDVECKSIFIIIIIMISSIISIRKDFVQKQFLFIAYNFIFQEELFIRSYCLLVIES